MVVVVVMVIMAIVRPARQHSAHSIADKSTANLATTTSNSDSPKQTQNSNSDSSSASAAPKSTSKPSQTFKNADSPSSGDTNTQSSNNTTTRTVGPNAAPGGIQMITPAATAATSVYYSVGSTITWAWNYTSLVNPPARIDIVATMAAPPNGGGAPQPYTLGSNVTWNKLQNYTWDSGKFASKTAAFRNGMYTLVVFDAEVSGGMTAVPVGGSLGVNRQFHFGMYNGQDYTELADPYRCATCNDAMGRVGFLTVWGVLGMVGVTVASFTWFVVGWGVL